MTLKKTKVNVVLTEDSVKFTKLVTVEDRPEENSVSSVVMPAPEFMDLIDGMLKNRKGAKAIEFKTAYRGFVEYEG